MLGVELETGGQKEWNGKLLWQIIDESWVNIW